MHRSATRWIGVLFFVWLVAATVLLFVARPRPLSQSAGIPTPSLAPPPPLEVLPPESPRFVGVVLPNEAVEVTAKTDGQVRAIPIGLGEHVGEGSLLALVDSPSLTPSDLLIVEADLRSAEAELRRLGIEIAQARERLARAVSLAEQQLVTAEQMADVRYQEQLAGARLASAESLVAQKRAAVEQRKLMLMNTQIRAPFSGIVATRYVERGATVARGTPIVRLVATTKLKLRFAVPASEASRLRIGQEVEARVEDVEVVLTGLVTTMAPEIDPASQVLVVEAELTPPPASASSAIALAGRVASVHVILPAGRRTAARQEPRASF